MLDEFAERVRTSKHSLLKILKRFKNENKKVISYGATSKSATIFNYCQIGTDLIQYITDTTPEKQGKYSPGMHIPIISPEEGFDNSVDYAFLGAWNFQKEIKNKEIKQERKGIRKAMKQHNMKCHTAWPRSSPEAIFGSTKCRVFLGGGGGGPFPTPGSNQCTAQTLRPA